MKIGPSSVASVIFLLVYNGPSIHAKKKIVKLIVPHKIKYVHHTHVLLVKPASHRKLPKIHEEVIEEVPYRHDWSPGRSKSYVRYLVPSYPSESKRLSYRLPPDHHIGGDEFPPRVREGYFSSDLPQEITLAMRGSHEENQLELDASGGNEVDPWSPDHNFPPNYRPPMPSAEEEPPQPTSPEAYQTLPYAHDYLNHYSSDSHNSNDHDWSSTTYSHPETYLKPSTYADYSHETWMSSSKPPVSSQYSFSGNPTAQEDYINLHDGSPYEDINEHNVYYSGKVAMRKPERGRFENAYSHSSAQSTGSDGPWMSFEGRRYPGNTNKIYKKIILDSAPSNSYHVPEKKLPVKWRTAYSGN